MGGVLKALRLIRVPRYVHDADHLTPSVVSSVASGTMFVGGQAVAELEMIVDAATGREEALRVPG